MKVGKKSLGAPLFFPPRNASQAGASLHTWASAISNVQFPSGSRLHPFFSVFLTFPSDFDLAHLNYSPWVSFFCFCVIFFYYFNSFFFLFPTCLSSLSPPGFLLFGVLDSVPSRPPNSPSRSAAPTLTTDFPPHSAQFPFPHFLGLPLPSSFPFLLFPSPPPFPSLYTSSGFSRLRSSAAHLSPCTL